MDRAVTRPRTGAYLAFFRLKRAIFVHGCFWHQHKQGTCKRSSLPKSNLDYWKLKLMRNVIRDRETQRQLRRDGWKILIIWECECGKVERVRRKLSSFLVTAGHTP